MDDAQSTHLAGLLEEMCCGDPAETARAFCSRHRPRDVVLGRDARMLVYEVAEAVVQAQPVERCERGVRPWSGGPGAAPLGVALMDAAAGSLAVVALTVTADGYQVPDNAQAGTLPPSADGAACPCGCGYGGDSPRVTPDGATLAHAAAYGEDPFVNAAEAARQPGELDTLDNAEPLLMAALPGPEYYAWRHVALGVWVARPGAATADVPPSDPAAAVPTTAGEVRGLLHAKGKTAR